METGLFRRPECLSVYVTEVATTSVATNRMVSFPLGLAETCHSKLDHW